MGIKLKERKKISSGQTTEEQKQKGTITVRSGIISLNNLKLEGKTVGEIREKLRTPLNIGDEEIAQVGGKEVGDDYSLKENDVLEFVERARAKGYKMNIE